MIDGREALVAFLDEEAQAFARGAVEGYTRARAKVDADVLLARPDVAALLARAAAEAYPFALTLLAEVAESVHAPLAYDRAAERHGLIAAAVAAFGRRAVPAPGTADAWNLGRAEMVRWLGNPSRQAARTTEEIVEPFVGSLLALMPIHDLLGRDDFRQLRGALRVALAGAHERFAARVNASALAKTLTARA